MNGLTLEHTGAVPQGTLRLPASKSISNRLLILEFLFCQKLSAEGYAEAGDTRVLQNALKALEEGKERIDLADAGTAMRFFTALAATVPGERELIGTDRMYQRPIAPLVEALRDIGAKVEYRGKEGFPPLRVKGSSLKGGRVELRSDVSSQFLSALALIAPVTEEGIELLPQGDPVSTPYFRTSIALLNELGVPVEENGISVKILPYDMPPCTYKVEGDHSAAAFWYELLALQGKGALFLEGIRKDSPQGDRDAPVFYRGLGVQERWQEEACWIEAVPGPFQDPPYEADMRHYPDLVPALAVTLAGRGCPGILQGVASLRNKESDRLEALRRELLKIGVELHTDEDKLGIDPKGLDLKVRPRFDAHGDHRIAMALAPLISLLPGLSIRDPEVVKKSYPGFWEDLERVFPGVRKRD